MTCTLASTPIPAPWLRLPPTYMEAWYHSYIFLNNHHVVEVYEKYWHLCQTDFKIIDRFISVGSQKTPFKWHRVNDMYDHSEKSAKFAASKSYPFTSVGKLKAIIDQGFPARGHLVRNGSLCCVYPGLYKFWYHNGLSGLICRASYKENFLFRTVGLIVRWYTKKSFKIFSTV